MRTFSQLKTNIGNNIQDTSSATAAIIGSYINDTYFDLLRRINWEEIISTYIFTTYEGQADYTLPVNFNKETYVFNKTNKIELTNVSLQEEVQNYPEEYGSQGCISRYTILKRPNVTNIGTASGYGDLAWGTSPWGGGFVGTQSVVTVVSTSSADTTQTVHIRGISSGVEMKEDVTLTGTTEASTTNDFSSIISISKSATTTGVITITASSGATTLATMGPNDLVFRAKILRLHNIPSTNEEIEVAYKIKPQELSDDNDFPLLDADDVIEEGATAKIWRYKRQGQKAATHDALYREGIINLIWEQENKENMVHRFNYVPYERTA